MKDVLDPENLAYMFSCFETASSTPNADVIDPRDRLNVNMTKLGPQPSSLSHQTVTLPPLDSLGVRRAVLNTIVPPFPPGSTTYSGIHWETAEYQTTLMIQRLGNGAMVAGATVRRASDPIDDYTETPATVYDDPEATGRATLASALILGAYAAQDIVKVEKS